MAAGTESRRTRTLLAAIFTVSGACALAYQVLWIRSLSHVFGVTTAAMSVVLSTFMAGLALGSFLVGRRADAVRRPLRTYAYIELALGAAALAVPWGIDAARAFHVGFLPHDLGPMARLAAQAAEVSVVLLVPTTLMGATLPLLSAWISRDADRRGRDLGLLYALNAGGAALGCTLTGMYAIEALGLSATNRVAAFGNLVVAVGALLLDRADSPSPAPAEETVIRPPRWWSQQTVLVVAGACGALSLAWEVVWVRLLSQLVLTTTYAFTCVLAVVIAGLAAGSLAVARRADRAADPGLLFGRIELVQAIACFGAFPLLAFAAADPRRLEYLTTELSALPVLVLALAGVPAFCMGATYPVLARLVADGRTDVGRSVARMYSTNTIGGIVGAAVGGFLLIPYAGVLGAVLLLALCNAALGLWALRPRSEAPLLRRPVDLVAIVLTLLAVDTSRGAHLEHLFQARLPPDGRIVDMRETSVSTAMVSVQGVAGVRRVWINSCWVAGTGGSHRMLGHYSMLFARAPERVLGIAFGTGQSFGTTLLYEPDSIDVVDIDPGVVELGGTYFADVNSNLLNRPNVELHLADGREFLTRTKERFDVILMEPLQPWSVGTVNLYTVEFYREALRALDDGGVMAQWLPIFDITPEATRAALAAVAEVFPEVYVFFDHRELWIVGALEPPDLAVMERRAAEAGIAEGLRSVGYVGVESVLSSLVLDAAGVRELAGTTSPLSDDRPFIEFESPRVMLEPLLATNLEEIVAHVGFPEGWRGRVDSAVGEGEAARALLSAELRLARGDIEGTRDRMAAAFRAMPSVFLIRHQYRLATLRWGRTLAAEKRELESMEAYRRHLEDDPDAGAVWWKLGIMLAAANRPDEATAAWDQAERDPAMVQRVEEARATLRRVLAR